MPAVLTTKMIEKAIRDVDTYDLSDARVPGLSIRCRPSSAVWMVRVNHKKHTVGPAQDLPLPQARALATELIARVKAGFAVDAHWIQRQKVAMGVVEDGTPALPEPVVRKKTWTWEEAIDAYLREVSRNKQPATHKNYSSVLRNPSVTETMAGKYVADVDADMVASMVQRIHASGREAQAEIVLVVMRAMWKFLSREGDNRTASGVLVNVLKGLEKPERSRGYGRKTRSPDVETCARVIAACRLGVFDRTVGLALELLVLSAQRRLTVATAEVGHFTGKVWKIPGEHMKGGDEHHIAMTPRIKEIVAAAAEDAGAGGTWLFPQRRARRRGMDLSHLHESTLSHNLLHFTGSASPHDIRRAITTTLVEEDEEDGDEEDALENAKLFTNDDAALVLDHREGRKTVTQKHYNKAKYLRKKLAFLTAWDEALAPHVEKAMAEMDVKGEREKLAKIRASKSRYKTGVRPKIPNVGRQLRIERAAKDAVAAALRDRKTQEDGRIRDVLSMVAERRIGDEEAMHLLRLDNALSLLISLSNFGFDAHLRADLATEAAATALEKQGLRSPFGATTPEAASAAREILHACVDYVIETAAQHYRKPPAARSVAGRPAGRADLHAG